MEQQIKPDAWGSARIARISQQFLHQNCQQMLQKEHCHPVTLQIWMEWRYHVWVHDARSYFETFIRSPRQFL